MCDGLSHLREACQGADGVLQPFSAQVTKPQVSNEAPPSTVLNCPWPNTNSILPSRGTNSLWPQSWCGLSRRLCGLLRRPICHLRHPKHFVLWLCHREISNPLSKPNKKKHKPKQYQPATCPTTLSSPHSGKPGKGWRSRIQMPPDLLWVDEGRPLTYTMRMLYGAETWDSWADMLLFVH